MCIWLRCCWYMNITQAMAERGTSRVRHRWHRLGYSDPQYKPKTVLVYNRNPYTIIRRCLLSEWRSIFTVQSTLSYMTSSSVQIVQPTQNAINVTMISNDYAIIPFRNRNHVIIKWKHFPRYRPFVRGIHRSPVNSRTKASDAELWCFLWSASE